MGKTLLKACPRCKKRNYMDVDKKFFRCPNCGAKIEIYDEDIRNSILTIPKYKSKKYTKKVNKKVPSEKPTFYIVFFLAVLLVCFYEFILIIKEGSTDFSFGLRTTSPAKNDAELKTDFLRNLIYEYNYTYNGAKFYFRYNPDNEEYRLYYYTTDGYLVNYPLKVVKYGHNKSATFDGGDFKVGVFIIDDRLLVNVYDNFGFDTNLNLINEKEFYSN